MDLLSLDWRIVQESNKGYQKNCLKEIELKEFGIISENIKDCSSSASLCEGVRLKFNSIRHFLSM